jgi:Mg-chelatase subunit ChlI
MSMSEDAAVVAALFAVDPVGTGGVCLHSQVHPARDQWLGMLEYLLPEHSPLKRIPCNISDGRLLGGLDLVATLKANRPVAEQGVLASSDGGVVVVRMAERLSEHTAAALGAVMDAGEVVLLREAVSGHLPARLGIVAMDEGIGDDEVVPRSLMDRLGFILDFDGLTTRATLVPLHDAEQILAARALLPAVALDDDMVERLCGTALALGVDSLRLSVLATHVARVAAALEGRARINEADAILAAKLVLAPRATRMPPDQSQPPADATPTITVGSPPRIGRRGPNRRRLRRRRRPTRRAPTRMPRPRDRRIHRRRRRRSRPSRMPAESSRTECWRLRALPYRQDSWRSYRRIWRWPPPPVGRAQARQEGNGRARVAAGQQAYAAGRRVAMPGSTSSRPCVPPPHGSVCAAGSRATRVCESCPRIFV